MSAILNKLRTSISWDVRLSWLENAYIRPLFLAGDFDQ